jgi:hypothetical protein
MGRVEELCAFVEVVYPELDLYNYYQLLEVEPKARAEEIKAAFYRQAARLHPDRFANLPGGNTRQQLMAIYARIAEAYKVLADSQKRKAYDANLPAGQLRFIAVEREKKGPQNPEDQITHPEAKKFFRLGLQAMRVNDVKGCVMNLKFALNYEPDNGLIKQQLAEAEQRAKNSGSMSGIKT